MGEKMTQDELEAYLRSLSEDGHTPCGRVDLEVVPGESEAMPTCNRESLFYRDPFTGKPKSNPTFPA